MLLALWWAWSPARLNYTIEGERIAWGDRRATLGREIGATNTARLVRFSDGTRVRLAPESTLRVTALSERAAQLLLDRGTLQAKVFRGGGRWRFLAGPYEVVVLGTQFQLSWDPAGRVLDLAMHKGRVELRGPVVKRLAVVAGEALRVWPDQGKLELMPRKPRPAVALAQRPQTSTEDAPASSQPASRPSISGARRKARLRKSALPTPIVVGKPTVSAPVVARQPAGATTPPAAASDLSSPGAAPLAANHAPRRSAIDRHALAQRFYGFARAGDFRRAAEQAQRIGWPWLSAQASNAADLLMVGDVARYSGQAATAKRLYNELVERFADRAQAAAAVFALGCLAMDHERDYAAARQHFVRYLASPSKLAFVVEAEGRLLETLQLLGQQRAARQQAEHYLQRYPRGSHAQRARRLLQGK